MNYKALDEALNFLNTGKMPLNHANNLINTYGKLSHRPLKDEKDDTGFYKFHDDIKKKMESILKPYSLKCVPYGIYVDKNSLLPKRVFTIILAKGKMNDDDYGIAVAKLMNDYKGNLLTTELDKLSKKIKVTDVNYCYTVAYKIYSIDITYTKE